MLTPGEIRRRYKEPEAKVLVRSKAGYVISLPYTSAAMSGQRYVLVINGLDMPIYTNDLIWARGQLGEPSLFQY